jgi:hypothetical protein
MSVFKDDSEIYRYVGGIFEAALADPQIGPKFADSGVILKVQYTDPAAVITVDMPAGKVLYGADAVAGPKPVVEMFMAADTANKFWLGKVNISLALAKGQIRAKGPVPKILKLVPMAKALFPSYEAMLEQDGRMDLINAA